MWALIANVAVAAIGGYMARKSQKKAAAAQEKQQRNYYSDLRKSAQHGGFNPLTALRNGGGAGYSHVASQRPIFATSVSDIFGKAAMAGLNYAAEYDPFAQQKSKLERDIMVGQLDRINQTNDYFKKINSNGFGKVPSSTASRLTGTNLSGSQKVTTLSQRLELGTPDFPKKGKVTVTNPITNLVNWQSNPYFPDSAAWEERYGDVGELEAFVVNNIADFGWNIKRFYDAVPSVYVAEKKKGFIHSKPSTRKKTGTFWDYLPQVNFKWD